jgi:hypothetical protein
LSAALGTAIALVVVLPPLVSWLQQHDRLIVLQGGNDPLGYEFFARDIAMNSPLMLLGARWGRQDPSTTRPSIHAF